MKVPKDPGLGQGILWTPSEIKSPTLSDLGIEPDRVVTISRLLRAVSDYMDLPPSYATHDSYELAEPEIIHQGLYIDRRDPRFRTAENLFMGVVHPSQEFGQIARSPSDLARHTKSKTRKSYRLEELMVAGRMETKFVDKHGVEIDRDEIEARVNRSAGHQLERYTVGLEERRVELLTRRMALLALGTELRSPGLAHYKAENLDKLRIEGERSIREAVEVASINMEWGSVTVDGLHQAAMYKIYGLPGHNNARLKNFLPWTRLTHRWLQARIHTLETALESCRQELAIYQPALDAAEELG